MTIMAFFAAEMMGHDFLLIFQGTEEENGVTWTLPYTALMLALPAGNGCNKLFFFSTSDVLRIRNNFLSWTHACTCLDAIFALDFLQKH